MGKPWKNTCARPEELRDNTFSGSDHEDANEHIEKVLEIVDLFHIYEITQDQTMLRAFPMSLTGAASRWLRNEPSAWERFKELLMRCPQHYLTDMQEVILFYNGLEVPTRQILDSKDEMSTRTRSTKTSNGLATIQAQLKNLRIKKVNEKVYAAQVGCELCKRPHYTNDCPLKEEGKYLKKHITLNLVCHSHKEDNIKQQLQDSSKGTIETLHIKSEDNQWKNR
ncbi:hypothetical protein Tco_1519834 [Tanacetum coccineum]